MLTPLPYAEFRKTCLASLYLYVWLSFLLIPQTAFMHDVSDMYSRVRDVLFVVTRLVLMI